MRQMGEWWRTQEQVSTRALPGQLEGGATPLHASGNESEAMGRSTRPYKTRARIKRSRSDCASSLALARGDAAIVTDLDEARRRVGLFLQVPVVSVPNELIEPMGGARRQHRQHKPSPPPFKLDAHHHRPLAGRHVLARDCTRHTRTPTSQVSRWETGSGLEARGGGRAADRAAVCVCHVLGCG